MPLSLYELDGVRGYRIQGAMLDFTERAPLAAAGDVNGDGFDDFLLADQNTDPATVDGIAYVVFGSAEGPGAALDLAALTPEQGFSYSTGILGDAFGHVVAGAGDLNGDGFADIAISAPTATAGGEDDAGIIHILWGGTDGISAVTTVEGGAYDVAFFGFTFEIGTEIGLALAGGDLDGDGLSDLVIVGGGPSGILPGTPADWDDPALFPGLDGADGTPLGEVSAAVAPGDMNGDGIADLAFAVDWLDGPWGQSGISVYVAFGSPEGFAAGLEPADLALGTGRILTEVPGSDISPAAFASAGDVNGDGLADIVIGAPSATGNYGGNAYDGAAYVLLGGAGPFQLDADALGEGTGFKIVHTGPDGSVDLGASVAGAGDVNGDGLDDLIIGAPRTDSGGFPDAGAAYVLYGRVDGFPGVVDLAALDPRAGFAISGTAGLEWTGLFVSAAGDANGDGFADILVSGRETSALLYGAGISGISGPTAVEEGNSGETQVTLTVSLSGPALTEIALSYETLGETASPGSDFAPASGTLLFAEGESEKTITLTVYGDLEGEADETFSVRFFNPDGAGFGGPGELVHTLTISNDDEVELLFGTDEEDTLIGGGTRDVIEGGKKNDWVEGWSGDDSLLGGHGDDTVLGGDGNDTLLGGDQYDALFGGAGHDLLEGGHGDDALAGDDGDDTLLGETGADTLEGGDGRDSLDGGYANDEINGGAGDDTLDGGGGDDYLFAGDFDIGEVLIGGAGNDTLFSEGGDDYAQGGEGNDEINTDAGQDTVFGNAGNDIIDFSGTEEIGAGAIAYGGPGNDLISVHGHATLYGGDGHDQIAANSGLSIEAYGGAGNDYLVGDGGADTLKGGDGADTLEGASNHDSLVGGNGDDELYGGGGHDTLEGNPGDDLVNAGWGNDKVIGGPGTDRLIGEDGADTLLGGGEADTLEGGFGNDLLEGGADADIYHFSGSFGHDTILGWERGVDVLEFTGGPASYAELSITPHNFGMLIEWSGQSLYLAETGFVALNASDFTFL